MSQKSSVPPAISFVSQVLKRDNFELIGKPVWRYLAEVSRTAG